MLLQSYAGFIEVFPAVPSGWKVISFNTLRAEGAFLISAKKENGKVTEIKITGEKGGKTTLKLPFKKWKVASINNVQEKQNKDGFLDLSFDKKGSIIIQGIYK
jgi:alpha-L-fucosidase 2